MKPEKEDELIPCPFCGLSATKIDRFTIGCNSCNYSLNGLPHLINEMWNTRAKQGKQNERPS